MKAKKSYDNDSLAFSAGRMPVKWLALPASDCHKVHYVSDRSTVRPSVATLTSAHFLPATLTLVDAAELTALAAGNLVHAPDLSVLVGGGEGTRHANLTKRLESVCERLGDNLRLRGNVFAVTKSKQRRVTMNSDNLQTDSSKWTEADTQRSRLERTLKRKGFTDVVVDVADASEIDGPFFLRFDDGYTASGEYEELSRCIAQASESDTDSLKALLRNAEESAS